jgi:nitrate reductase gamma subunit
MLFGVGGAAVLAGLGSLGYRRRLARKLRKEQATRKSPGDREPAGQ